MSASAIMMMILSIVLVWGGMVAAVVNLMRRSGKVPGETQRDL